jgi:transposase, IS6 family
LVDRQFGQVTDVLVSQKRDLAAIRRFFTRALERGPPPTEVITDKAAIYPPVLDELTPGAWFTQFTIDRIVALA